MQDKGTRSNVDRKDYVDDGKYYLFANCSNLPTAHNCFLYVYRHIKSESNHIYLTHIAIDATDGSTWVDVCDYGTWRGWKRIDNFGCNTAADLASLLGGSYIQEFTSTNPLGDFDSLTQPGRYVFKQDAAMTNAAHKPSGTIMAPAYLDVFEYGLQKFQKLTSLVGTSGNYVDAIYVRRFGNPSSNWQRIDNYGTSSLSELASALGAIQVLESITDLNAISKTSICTFNNNILNTPFSYGICVTFYISNSYNIQIAANVSSGKKFAIRRNFADWFEISTTQI